MTIAYEPEILARTEAEVAADTVWALVEAKVLSRKEDALRAALAATHLTIDDLRLASIRWERRRKIPTPSSAVTHPERRLTNRERACPELGMIPDAPVSVPDNLAAAMHDAGAPDLAPVITLPTPRAMHPSVRPRPARTPVHRPPEMLECRRCRQSKPIEDFTRPARQRRVCLDCAVNQIVQRVKAGRVGTRAHVAVALEPGDDAVGLWCSECGVVLDVGDVMVVEAKPRHEQCPQ